jgi:hypothetical protein
MMGFIRVPLDAVTRCGFEVSVVLSGGVSERRLAEATRSGPQGTTDASARCGKFSGIWPGFQHR